MWATFAWRPYVCRSCECRSCKVISLLLLRHSGVQLNVWSMFGWVSTADRSETLWTGTFPTPPVILCKWRQICSCFSVWSYPFEDIKSQKATGRQLSPQWVRVLSQFLIRHSDVNFGRADKVYIWGVSISQKSTQTNYQNPPTLVFRLCHKKWQATSKLVCSINVYRAVFGQEQHSLFLFFLYSASSSITFPTCFILLVLKFSLSLLV